MAEPVAGERRTRSKGAAALDTFNFRRSPLKDARSAYRNNPNSGPSKVDNQPDSLSDDEILLSPKRQQESRINGNSKRSASPVDDDDRSSSTGRDLKRPKHSHNSDEENVAIAARHSSEPAARSPGSRSAAGRHSSPPTVSTTASPRSPSREKGRSRSVPRFHPSSPVPYLNSRSSQSSPFRKSPSPNREAKLVFLSGPNSTSDGQIIDPPVASPSVDSENRDSTVEHRTFTIGSSESVPKEKKKLLPTISEVPSTPVQDAPLPVPNFSLSPLTPLPPTPMVATTHAKPFTIKPRANLFQGMDVPSNTATTQQSRLPRPSVKAPSAPGGSKAISSMGPPGQPGPSNAYKSHSSAISVKNAFDIMMKRAPSGVDKGKGKSVVPSSSTAPTASKAANIKSAKAKGKQKFKQVAASKPVASITAKMKPRAKAKIAPLTMVEDEEDVEDERPPSPQPFTLVPSVSNDLPSSSENQPSSSGSKDPETSVLDTPTFPRDVVVADVSFEGPTDTHDSAMREAELQSPSKGENEHQEGHEDVVMNDVTTDSTQSKVDSYSGLSLGQPSANDSSSPGPRRSTRSTSVKRKADTLVGSKDPRPAPKRFASGKAKTVTHTSTTSEMKSDDPASDAPTEPTTPPPSSPAKPASPSKSMSFARPTASSAAKVVLSRSPSKPRATPSPSKIARSSSMNSARPSGAFIRSFESGPGPSSLSNLSSALEKLRMPVPERASTSLGFNQERSGLQRASTVGPESFSDSGSKESSMEDVGTPKTPGTGSKPKSSIGVGNSQLRSTGGALLRSQGGSSRPLFLTGNRGRSAYKVSKNPSLPSVMASPSKRSEGDSELNSITNGVEVGEHQQADAETMDTVDGQDLQGAESAADTSVDLNGENDTSRPGPNRRFSAVSHALSQSLSALPPPQPKKTNMGPPSTPPRRSTRPGLRSSSSAYPQSAPDLTLVNETPSTGSTGSATDGSKTGPPNSKGKQKVVGPKLTALKDCVVFVDVKGSGGGDAFADMLRNLGARVLVNIGSTCTHIVFKDGSLNTINKFKSLDEPRPLAVGVNWVVECAAQQAKVDEAKYVVDLDGMNIAGNKERRRSGGPPKIKTFEDDLSVSEDAAKEGELSAEAADGLTPLERARLRRMHSAETPTN